jgi:hypothetical protein
MMSGRALPFIMDQTRWCVRVGLRAARSSRAADSPLTCSRSRSSRSASAGGGFRVQLRHPQADDPHERWLQLAHKAVRYALCLRASEFASTAQRLHERRRVARRVARRAPASFSDHQDLLSFVSVLPVAPGGTQRAWLHGVPGILGAFSLLAIFWHKKSPDEITRFPWSRLAALVVVVACSRASSLMCAGAAWLGLGGYTAWHYIHCYAGACTGTSFTLLCCAGALKRVRVSVVRVPAPPVLCVVVGGCHCGSACMCVDCTLVMASLTPPSQIRSVSRHGRRRGRRRRHCGAARAA